MAIQSKLNNFDSVGSIEKVQVFTISFSIRRSTEPIATWPFYMLVR